MAETVTLEMLGAMMRQALDDIRAIETRQLEHTTWLAKLEEGQSLTLRMVTRLAADLERVRRALQLTPAKEG
jgi:hypothetical protein